MSLDDVREHRPDIGLTWVVLEPVSYLDADLVQEMRRSTRGRMRYHNVLCALRLCKPTISVGYSSKNDALWRIWGWPISASAARSLDVDG